MILQDYIDTISKNQEIRPSITKFQGPGLGHKIREITYLITANYLSFLYQYSDFPSKGKESTNFVPSEGKQFKYSPGVLFPVRSVL